MLSAFLEKKKKPSSFFFLHFIRIQLAFFFSYVRQVLDDDFAVL